MSASLSEFASSPKFLWLQVVLAIWLYVRWISILRLPWILFRRCFKWEPIYTKAKFMSCYLDVSYNITPLSGEPTVFGNPEISVTDQSGICSTRYFRSGNGYGVICKYEKHERVFLVDRAVIKDFFQAVNLMNEGYVLCTAMRSLLPGVYLCSITDPFTFLEVVSATRYFCFYQMEVHMIIDREPLSMDTPTYAKIFDTLPFIAQAKGYQVLSAILSALILLGSFFTPLPWITLNLIGRTSKNFFQWVMGLRSLTNKILLFLSTLIPVLRPLNTVTNRVSYVKCTMTYMRGGQALPPGYSLILTDEINTIITAQHRLVYNFENVKMEMQVIEIIENAAVVNLLFLRDAEIHSYDGLRIGVEDLAVMDAVFSNWMGCCDVPPILTHRGIGGLYVCTQSTTLFQILSDAVVERSYHLVLLRNSIME